MLRRFRIASQTILFLMFLVVLAGYGRLWHEGHVSPLAWFMRLEPFTAVITSIAARTFVVGAVTLAGGMILLTILFGRFFCSWICPLGTLVDAVDAVVRAGRKIKPPFRLPLTLHRTKYLILFAMIVLASAGMIFPLFMDPMLISVRFATLLARPEAMSAAALIPGAVGKIYAKNTWVLNGAIGGVFGTLLLLIAVFAGTFLDRRFWCQYICPSGAFLGLLSRFSFVKRITTCGREGGGCGVCTSVHCPTRAIPSGDFTRIVKAECILCGNCTADKRKCGRFTLALPHKIKVDNPDLRKRHALLGLAGGLALMPALLRPAPIRQIAEPGPVRPPGAVDEDLFLERCLTCQACVGACPNSALHPVPLSEGLKNWNTPQIVGRLGYCLPECTRCSSACPTGALEPIVVADKKKAKVGVAVVERGRCRSWNCERTCTVCIDNCPYEALDSVQHTDAAGESYDSPVVNRVKCVGCGACEFQCPVNGDKAIRIYGIKRPPKRKPLAKK